MNTKQKSEPTLQKVQFLILKNLSKSLNVSESEILIAIKQMGYDPNKIHESWEPAIANHLTGTKPQTLKGTKPESTPESFSIEDSEEFIDWDDIENELGETALALVQELGLNQDAISQSDLATLRELALSNPVHQNLADHIGAVGSVQEGLTNEHIRVQFETGSAIGEAGSVALITGLLQSQLNGLQQAYTLQTAINSDFQKIINSQLENLGKTNKGTPDKTVQDLGKQATSHQQNSKKSSTIRTQKVDVMTIKKSLNK
ncbi:hypothetical protein [Planktothrix agardhii]|uniref:hypothetical protein n=1 Tax=Planktothrix agardhii TaxID=1160 RepID=UPI001F3B497C|nr:hypothetical protein [Planktothrix agardhii]MCF3578877.1 hypothetical protein [Planktothrix agardhii 1812]MCF3587867.1 hypothetical protein [Planktothrix agardhii 1803]